MIDSRNIFGGTTTQSATKFLYNRFTQSSWSSVGSMSTLPSAVSNLSGSLTANTLVDLISESGSAGQIDQLSIFTVDATARTIRVVITVDGVVISDATSGSITAANSGGFWAGVGGSGAGFNDQLPPIRHTNSIRVQYASSLTESGKFTTCLAYQRTT